MRWGEVKWGKLRWGEDPISYLSTVANRSISKSEAPNEANPMVCEKSANSLSANIGTWPRSSCTQSLWVSGRVSVLLCELVSEWVSEWVNE